ncbi:MAG: ankyrin repeat domain-containing protein [Rickettsiaceae bacterium]|nr:ankyrin repeat domain-containing protein [Rickettsiaceae bacterium]
METQKSSTNLLTDKKVDIEKKDINGNTPLMDAVSKGNLDAIDFLLSKNADIDAKNHEGITPLMRAASGRKEAMYLLIEQGATVDEKTIQIAAKTFGKDHQIVNYTKAINKEQTAEQSFLDALNKIKDNTTLKEEIGSDDARKLCYDIDTMISSYREQKPREKKLNNLKQNMKDLESWVSTRTNYSMDILMDDIQEMFSTCLPTNVNEDLSKSHKRTNIKNYHDTISTQHKKLGTHTTRVIESKITKRTKAEKEGNAGRTP